MEPVSDYLAPPTPLFPLPAHSASPPIRQAQGMPIRQAQGMLPRGQASRESEICSFLRHSVRLLAEGVASPARICNAGADFWDTSVALRGRGGQGGLSKGHSAVSSLPQPTRDAPTDAWGLPRLGVGFPAAGSVPRVGEGSTRVRILQEGWRNCGIGADWWGEMVQTWGRRGSCVGLDGSGPGNGWHARVTFFRVRGSERVGFGRWGAAGVYRGHWLSNMANARRWPQVQSRARGQAVGEGDGFGRT